MKRSLFFFALIGAAFVSCDLIKQNNLFEVINKKPEFLVSVSVSGYRSDECTASVTPERQVNGDRVTLYALPGPRSRFLSWQRTSGAGDLENPAAATTSFTIRASAASLVASFGPALHDLTLSPVPTRGTMLLDTSPFSGTTNLEDETTHSIEAVPSTDPASFFTQWVYAGSGVAISDVVSPSTTIRLTAGGASVAPRFALSLTDLKVNAVSSGSSVPGRTEPSGIVKAGVGSTEEEAFYIRAIPNEGARFLGWELESGSATFGDAKAEYTTVNCLEPYPAVSIRARFALNTYTLTLAADAGGSAIPSPAPAGWPVVEHGQTVNIVATANSGYAFTGWTADPAGNASFGNASAASTTVSLSGPATVRAHFSSSPLTELARTTRLDNQGYLRTAVTLFPRTNAGALISNDVVAASSNATGTEGGAHFFDAASLASKSSIVFDSNDGDDARGAQPLVVFNQQGSSGVCVPTKALGGGKGFYYIDYNLLNRGYKGGGQGTPQGPMAAFADNEYLATYRAGGSNVERYYLDEQDMQGETVGIGPAPDGGGGMAITRLGKLYTRGLDETNDKLSIFEFPYTIGSEQGASYILSLGDFGGASSYLSVDAQNRLVFATGNSSLKRYDPSNNLIQNYADLPVGTKVTNRDIIISGGRYYMTLDDGSLYSVSETSPGGSWRSGQIGALTSPVVSSSGTVYVGCSDGRVRAYSSNGNLAFTSEQLGSRISSELLLNEDGTLFVATEDGYIVMLKGDGTGLDPNAPWPMTGGNSRRTRCAADPKYGKAPLKILYFDSNGGTGNSTASGLEGTSTTHAGLGFNRTGYSFSGWRTMPSGGQFYGPYDEYTFGSADNQYLYAQWSPIIVYVSPSGYDSNDGRQPTSPVQTIAKAIEIAQDPQAHSIRVAVGNYTASSTLTIPNGVTLEGSWDTSFTSRDLANNDTLVEFTNDAGGTLFSIIGATSLTAIDGFRMKVPMQVTGTEGMSLITISNCPVGTVEIRNCTLSLAEVSASNSFGITCDNASPIIYNNVIYGGIASNLCSTLFLRAGSSPGIYNNTIVVGFNYNKRWLITLRLDGGSSCSPDLRNNILADFATEENSDYGVYHMNEGSNHTPKYLTTNLFYLSPYANGNGAYVYYGSTSSNNVNSTNVDSKQVYTLSAGTQVLQNTGAEWRNVVGEDPLFVNRFSGDFRLQASSPAATAGTDLSSLIPATDRNGNPRGGTWSIGAYE